MVWSMTIGGAIGGINGTPLSANAVGSTLFGPYVLVVELAAFLLLAALVVAIHIGRDERNEARWKAEHGERETTQAGEQ